MDMDRQEGSTATGPMKEGLESLKGLLQIDTATWSHVSGVRPDGTVVMWGINNYGQLGDGSYTNAIHPATVGGLSNNILRLGSGKIGDNVYDASKGNRLPNIVTVAENETVNIDISSITKSSGFNLISISDPVNVGNLEFKSMDISIATVNNDGIIKPNQSRGGIPGMALVGSKCSTSQRHSLSSRSGTGW